MLGAQVVKRLVEIGPSSTLTTMAKRTLNQKYNDHDTARSLERELLSCHSDADKVYYDVPSETMAAFSKNAETDSKISIFGGSVQPEMALSSETPAAKASISHVVQPAEQPGRDFATVPDSPISAGQILRTLVAHKLKRPVAEVPWSGSIKTLSGGRLPSYVLGQDETLMLSQADPSWRTR